MLNTALVYRSFGPPLQHLRVERHALEALGQGRIRVAMTCVPVNPSDVIPIAGAYAHRTRLPAIAGYEGIGVVVAAPASHAALIGPRVLPLRGDGTWQCYVDCDPALAVPVPPSIDDVVGARAYINPLAALSLLERWPVAGRTVLLCGAGSACAELLGRWALARGAAGVSGVYRSERRVARLLAAGIAPIAVDDADAVQAAARGADIVFDALGGAVGSAVLADMRPSSDFVGYGLLSGRGVQRPDRLFARVWRFHLRDVLPALSAQDWRQTFVRLWPLLRNLPHPAVEVLPVVEWRHAIARTAIPGRAKPVLSFGADPRVELPA